MDCIVQTNNPSTDRPSDRRAHPTNKQANERMTIECYRRFDLVKPMQKLHYNPFVIHLKTIRFHLPFYCAFRNEMFLIDPAGIHWNIAFRNFSSIERNATTNYFCTEIVLNTQMLHRPILLQVEFWRRRFVSIAGGFLFSNEIDISCNGVTRAISSLLLAATAATAVTAVVTFLNRS